jgi:hypothetical protein
MSNPNLVRKVSDSPSGGAGEISSEAVLSTSSKNRNYIINGSMAFAQRGISFAAIANNTYFLDRYIYSKVGTTVHTASRDADIPSVAEAGRLFENSLRLNLTTPDTSIATGDRVDIQHRLEGYNFANVAQKPFALSFWVKATLPGIYCVGLRNSGTDRSFVGEYAIDAANTWEKKIILVPASPSSGTWNYTNGVGLFISFTLAAGTDLQGTPNTWQTGNYIATSNQVNGVNTGATDFRITGIMLNEGTTAAPFQLAGRDFAGELALCQRYYQRGFQNAQGPAISASQCYCFYYLPVEMRAIPVLSFITGVPLTSLIDETGTSPRTPTTVGDINTTTKCVGMFFGGMTGMTGFRPTRTNIDAVQADAEL